jgi:tRNA wybutosine-synthesizing protein 1
MIPKKTQEMLKKQHYAIVGKGKHSAVQICRYAKKSLVDEDFCYKQKFYGINSHRCCQMAPSVMNCEHKCIFCWRPIEHNLGTKIKKIDSPEEIIEGCIKAQRKMLSGFGGNPKTNKIKLKESKEPKHFAISLSGEPTLYKKLPELIKLLDKQKITSFVVSNGENPGMLKRINPTQLYISMIAPNEKLFKKISCSCNKDCWKRYLETLKLLKEKSKSTRTVLRLTLIKNINMLEPDNYAKLLELAEPDFIEIKAYMHVGFSQQRLKKENMPEHEEVKKFAKEILKNLDKKLNYKLIDEKINSRVVLLSKGEKNSKIDF